MEVDINIIIIINSIGLSVILDCIRVLHFLARVATLVNAFCHFQTNSIVNASRKSLIWQSLTKKEVYSQPNSNNNANINKYISLTSSYFAQLDTSKSVPISDTLLTKANGGCKSRLKKRMREIHFLDGQASFCFDGCSMRRRLQLWLRLRCLQNQSLFCYYCEDEV